MVLLWAIACAAAAVDRVEWWGNGFIYKMFQLSHNCRPIRSAMETTLIRHTLSAMQSQENRGFTTFLCCVVFISFVFIEKFSWFG